MHGERGSDDGGGRAGVLAACSLGAAAKADSVEAVMARGKEKS